MAAMTKIGHFLPSRKDRGFDFSCSFVSRKQKGRPSVTGTAFEFNPGGDLRSRVVSSAVSSALQGLTSVFGMGTGVTLAVRPAGKSGCWRLDARDWNKAKS